VKPKPQKILVSVSNDITHDQRVDRICSTLVEDGFDVLLVGRMLKQSTTINVRPYQCKRLKLWFNKGLWFYAELNIRLFFFLLFKKCHHLLANDLDTLPANALVSFFKRNKLFYDSHELFTEVPELNNRKLTKKVWSFFEKISLKRVYKAYTVCDSIANYYQEKYGVAFATIRNLPFHDDKQIGFDSRENRIIYQGALNKDRGIELMIEAMQYIDGHELVIAGNGDIEDYLYNMNQQLGLAKKVHFLGKLKYDQLKELTRTCKLGLSLERNTNLNYYYALPNKIFDYINAGVPVLCSNLPEMAAIVSHYKVGEVFDGDTAKQLAQTINKLLENSKLLQNYHENCKIASEELNWEKEKSKLKTLFL
jgi:glycosyltransferase involved in cell wall biosynthesis